MSYILNIDTAVTTASVCLAQDGHPLNLQLHNVQKDHATWLHPAIKKIEEETGISLQQLDAIAISSGPGSYTGLRVGMAAAKGLCFALQKPLITINTLQMMAVAAQGAHTELLCPMIDARRMEVFTAVYDQELNEKQPYTNLILDKDSFHTLLKEHSVTFFGNGSNKFQNILQNKNAQFENREATAKHMTALAFSQFSQRKFANLAYTTPFYGKDFHLVATI